MTLPKDVLVPNLNASERDRMFIAIGNIVVNFQQVELWLAQILASILSLRVLEDGHVISSAMSFRQKVDLVVELYPRKKVHGHGVEMSLVKNSLYAAEEFRNRVVHSFWAVESPGKWVRIKSSIKGRKSFYPSISSVNVGQLEVAAASLLVIREWELVNAASLQAAVDALVNHNSDS